MHFAAFALVGESSQDPGLYYDNNAQLNGRGFQFATKHRAAEKKRHSEDGEEKRRKRGR